jgi:hypothetical protein
MRQDTLALFAATFVALFVSHQVADHWVQREWEAADKGKPGWAGRWACLSHVIQYTSNAVGFLILLFALTGVEWPTWRLAVGLAVSAVSHYVADRRTPLAKLAHWAGHDQFYRLGAPREGRDDNPSLGTGAYALDQSFHYLFLFFAALIIA